MSSNIKVNRICEYCNTGFIARTTKTRYCSKKCNSAGYKAKVRKSKIEKSNTEMEAVNVNPLDGLHTKEFLTVKDVAILLDCSKRSVYRLIDNGTLKAVNLSQRMTRVSRIELNLLLQKEEASITEKDSSPVYVLAEPQPQKITVEIENCYTITEIQQKFNISETLLQQLMKRNNIPKMKHGWYVYVPKELIDGLLEFHSK